MSFVPESQCATWKDFGCWTHDHSGCTKGTLDEVEEPAKKNSLTALQASDLRLGVLSVIDYNISNDVGDVKGTWNLP
jgi:hypothetical protein